MGYHVPSYGKVWSFGNPQTAYLVGSEVVVEEKVDGSQLSCCVHEGALYVRSKGAEIHLGAVPELFTNSVNTLVRLHSEGKLTEGLIYRMEAMKGPRHNTLTYGRAPLGNVVLFDVDNGQQTFMTPAERQAEADRLGIECVRTIFSGVIERSSQLDTFLGAESQLGGVTAEGIVVKPANAMAQYYQDGKRIAAKLVTEAFKETHRKNWMPDRPEKAALLDTIVESVSTPVRWEKAVMRIAERGELANEAKDIGPIMREVIADVESECQHEIKEMLWLSYRKEVLRMCSKDVPDWYKRRLAKQAFPEESK